MFGPVSRVLLASVLLLACAPRTPYQARHDYQKRQARAFAAPKLGARESWGAFQRVTVRVYATGAYTRGDSGWRGDFEEQVERVNAILKKRLQIELTIESQVEWPRARRGAPLTELIEALQAHDDGEGVDFVIGLVESLPHASASFKELGRAYLLGKHIVLRDMDDHSEREAIGQLDTLDAEARRELYRGRKRHKQITVLLHELGHTLGALHTTRRSDYMHPGYDNTQVHFSEANLVLMRKVLDYRTRPQQERDGEALVRSLSAFVQQHPEAGWVPAEREDFVRRLEAALQQAGAGAGANARAADDAPAVATPETDVSALPEAERARFAAAHAAAEEGRVQEAFEQASALADTHHGSYAVQSLACRLAMMAGRMTPSVQRYCERMSELAATENAAEPTR